jgi:hypothetical protein
MCVCRAGVAGLFIITTLAHVIEVLAVMKKAAVFKPKRAFAVVEFCCKWHITKRRSWERRCRCSARTHVAEGTAFVSR